MMLRTLLVITSATLWPGVAAAQEHATAIACETLLSARRLDATSGEGRRAEGEAGCRNIDRGTIGTVEQRALIGGVPYECMTITGSARCLWIVP